MILIQGLPGLDVTALPFQGVVQYDVVQDDKILALKLKSLARQSTCSAVYLLEGYNIDALQPDVAGKTLTYTSTDELIALISGSGSGSNLDKGEGGTEDVKSTESFVGSDGEVEVDRSASDDVSSSGVFDASEDMSDGIVIESGYDSAIQVETSDEMRERLLAKQAELEQREAQLEERNNDLDAAYKTLFEETNKIAEEANRKIEFLEAELVKQQSEIGNSQILKYLPNFVTPRQVVDYPLSDIEVASIKSTGVRITSFIAADDSCIRTLNLVNRMVSTGGKFYVLDLTGHNYLRKSLDLSGTGASKTLESILRGEEISTESNVGNARVVFSDIFNDMWLLSLDWGEVLTRLGRVLAGKGIHLVLVLGGISSFIPKVLATKFGGVSTCITVAKSEAFVVTRLINDIMFVEGVVKKTLFLGYTDADMTFVRAYASKLRGMQTLAYRSTDDVLWEEIFKVV